MPGRRKIIAVVDDSTLILKAARTALMDEYDVITLPGGPKLFAMLAQSPALPDLILLDVIMPGQNGYEVLKILKKDKNTAEIPVIFLTAQADKESELIGLSLGAVDYMSKPFTPHLLKKRLSIHLLLEQQKRELREINENLNVQVRKKTETICNLQAAVVRMMGDVVEYRDYTTGGHVTRTTQILSALIDNIPWDSAYAATLREWDIPMFLQSSQLHDIGKISTPDMILLKPGPLTVDEREEMKRHASVGADIIAKLQDEVEGSDFLEHAKIMAATHHEHWDGNGYPQGLKDGEIPLQGRMMAFADVYDALVSQRPYKQPFTHGQALDIISAQRGKQFDPELTDIFLKAAETFRPQ
ncbi:MAG: response regulator [Desulfovibrio sp.]|jgi:putative two-component system response regulator|nr:response regulator [Desulfovibrio sp.]